MESLEPMSKSDYGIFEDQRNFYKFAISKEAPFKFIKNNRFFNTKYDELSVVAKTEIKKGVVLLPLLSH